MPDEPVPILNKPIVAASAYLEAIGITGESPEQQQERIEKFKEQAFARIEGITGLAFDRETGKCTTEGNICMEGETEEGWEEICTKLGAEKDPQQVEQLWREAGAFLRRAAGVKQSTDI